MLQQINRVCACLCESERGGLGEKVFEFLYVCVCGVCTCVCGVCTCVWVCVRIHVYGGVLSLMVSLAVGVSLGVLTGFRGLCMGLGPAVFGVLFYLFHVDLGSTTAVSLHVNSTQMEHLLPPALQVSPHQSGIL